MKKSLSMSSMVALGMTVATFAGAFPAAAQEQASAMAASSASQRSALAAAVDSAMAADLLSKGVPSVSVVVTRGDELLLRRAWGTADVRSGRAADPSTMYAIGSVAKQFTAALVLRLAERGRLTVGDSLARHLSGIRPEWAGVTIGQLLNHTSGLPRGGFVDMNRIAEAVSFDTILARAAQNEMVSKPGTAHLYSNTGYVILGALIEKLYGKRYADVLREEIAQPLGLTSLRYCGDAAPGTVATGYLRSPEDGKLSPAPTLHPSQQLGASGICTTAVDLAKWNQALHGGRVLSAASYQAMTSAAGVAGNYGFGMTMGRVAWGDSIIAHGGQDVSGFVAHNAWYPANSLSVTILYNAVPSLPSGMTHTVAALALGKTPPAAAKQPGPAAIAGTPATGMSADEARRQFVGEYQMGSRVFEVGFENGSFVLTPPGGDKDPLVHQSGATYVAGSSGHRITFLADDQGRVTGFLAQADGEPARRLRKIK